MQIHSQPPFYRDEFLDSQTEKLVQERTKLDRNQAEKRRELAAREQALNSKEEAIAAKLELLASQEQAVLGRLEELDKAIKFLAIRSAEHQASLVGPQPAPVTQAEDCLG